MVYAPRTRLKLSKAIEASAELLRLERGNRMSYLRLLKLLYLADRTSLERFGRPITYDYYYALKHGPVPSQIYNLIKGEHPDAPQWSRVIVRDEYQVRLRTSGAPRSEHLSKAEVGVLHEVADQCRKLGDDWHIVDYLHDNCPEWARNKPPHDKTSRPIPLRDILEAVGLSDIADEIEDDLREESAMDDFFDADR
ncbi:MAG: SocA family protein [Phycisphaeraceae bacterium]|nr:SocA family protein [Phycisphaeraceae bacterium]